MNWGNLKVKRLYPGDLLLYPRETGTSPCITRHELGFLVQNIRCGGNDLQLRFYAAGWNGLSGDTNFVSCGDEDHN